MDCKFRNTQAEASVTMKHTISSLIVFATLCLLSGLSRAKQSSTIGEARPTEKKILIVYLSRTNNTKAIAEIIQHVVGGRLVALELETPYPADYHTTVQQVVHENETGYLPPLKTKIESIERYDVLFLGFPTWDMQLPPPIKSFLHQSDLKGKTVIPFNTNGGYGPGNTFATVRTRAREAQSWKDSALEAARRGTGNTWSSGMLGKRKRAAKLTFG